MQPAISKLAVISSCEAMMNEVTTETPPSKSGLTANDMVRETMMSQAPAASPQPVLRDTPVADGVATLHQDWENTPRVPASSATHSSETQMVGTPAFTSKPAGATSSPTIDEATHLQGVTDHETVDESDVSEALASGVARASKHTHQQPSTLAGAGAADGNPPTLDPEQYQLTAFHARGGMGEIWIAKDKRIGRDVALKTLRSGRGAVRHRFVLEAAITGRLEHPGVVPVHELGTDAAGKPYYSMKFIQGLSLKQAIDEFHQISVEDVGARVLRLQGLLQAFISICETIGYAHSRGIIHRDLKPENAMLGEFGETLVLDWGLARDRAAAPEAPQDPPGQTLLGSVNSTTTRAGALMGSPAYMAPEMLAGRSHLADERTDIYLLGGMLYEILAGQPPHRGRSVSDTAIAEPALTPRHWNPRVPRALEAICLKALALRPEDRYPSALQLADDVKRYLAREPVSVCPETWQERTVRWIRRHQILLRRSAIAAVLLASASIATVQNIENRRLENLERARRDVTSFQKLSDEAHYFAASTDRLDERTPFFDPALAARATADALVLSDPWGRSLENLPLPEARSTLRDELGSLLLISVQLRLRQQPSAESLAACRQDLDRAETLGGPSWGLSRLRAQCQNSPSASDTSSDAAHQSLPKTSLDHFLKGEAARVRATRLATQGETEWSIHRQQLEEAITEYRAAIRQQSGHFWSHFQLGRCYLSLGRHAEAVETLGTCIALRPQAAWAWSTRGLALALLGRIEEALSDLSTAIELDAEFVPARLNRGVAYWLTSQSPLIQQSADQLVLALQDLESVLAAPTPLMEAAYYRAAIRTNAGAPAAAIVDLDRVLAARPDFVPARQLRARLHLAEGRFDAGFADVDAVAQSSAENRQVKLTGWQRQYERGRFLRVLVSNPPPGIDMQRHELLTRALQELSAAAQPLNLGVDVTQHEPAARVFAEWGSVLELVGSPMDAVTAYSRALELNPDDANLLVKRGWLSALRLSRFEDAQTDFQHALKIDPEHAEAHAARGFLNAISTPDEVASLSAIKALLWGSGDYLILHNVACIYAELAIRQPISAAVHEQTAVDLLERGIQLWYRGGRSGPSPLDLARHETSFRKLSQRADFQLLVSPAPSGDAAKR